MEVRHEDNYRHKRALLLLIGPALAGNKELDRKQIYELKEKCRQSAERYEREVINPLRSKGAIISVENAYNARLNTCLIEQTNTYIEDLPKGVVKGYVFITVTDILTSKPIASCATDTPGIPLRNYVEGYFPTSWDECSGRIKQLMNE